MKRFLSGILFCFFLFHGGQAWATTLVSGTSVSGSIPNPYDVVTYNFDATAGQGVAIQGSAGYNVSIKVIPPSGGGGAIYNRWITNSAPETGTYTVEIRAQGTATGGFTLYYFAGGEGTSEGTIESGKSYAGTLPTNGMLSYSFSGTAGESIAIQTAGGNFRTYIRLYKPDGTYVNYTTDRWIPTNTLTATGTYTVLVTGIYVSDSGSMTLQFMKGGDPYGVSDGPVANGQPPGPMLSGGAYSGTLLENGMASYKFEGTAGQSFKLHVHADDAVYIRVYKPNGSYWSYQGNRWNGTLTDDGTYTVLIDFQSIYDSGDYILYYFKGGSETTSDGFLVSDAAEATPGKLPLNGLKSYEFSATVSTPITITTTAGYSRYFMIYKPDGTYWSWSYTGSFYNASAPVSGTYSLVYYGYYDSTEGDYTIAVSSTPVPPDPTTASKSKPNGCPDTAGEIKKTAGNSVKLASGSPAPASSPNIKGASLFTGNPINFDVGYKWQEETDYNAAGLSFTRTYRSDSTWTDNTVGDFWRHNYARSLSVSVGSTASITDGSGATTAYSWSGSVWEADDPSTTATFETITGGYKYTMQDGTVEKYDDSTLLLERIEYLGGGALNLAYNGSSQLTSVTNENGRSLSMTYSSGRIATLVTPDGTFTYAYDGNDNLSTVTRPDTEVRTYHYENGSYVNALTGITDEKGVRYATFGYDGSGRAISTQHAGGVDEYTITYNTSSSTVTNPLGKDTTYHYQNYQGVRRIVQVDGEASTNCVAAYKRFNYDGLGRVISMTDWENNVTRYEYDDRSNVTQITEAAGTSLQRITTITYNATFNLPDVITEPGGLKTDYDYDVYGRLTTMTLTDTNTSETRITTYAYNSNGTDGSGNTIIGRLDEINGPRTDVSDITSFDYDGNLNLTKITNAVGHEIDITARDSAGRPTTIEDPNNVETDLVYDSNGWLDTATVADGTAYDSVTDFDYDENGNLTQVTLPNGVTVEYTYDNAQRLTGIEDALGNTVTYTLNDANNITKTEYKNATPTLTFVHNRTFDELARILTSVGASSQTANFAWSKNSNLTTYTDPKSEDTTYGYDVLQRPTTVTDPLSGVAETGYNALDDVTSVEDQRTNTTTYTYNAFGDVTGEASPDRGTLSYTVDKAGNVTQRTDARSVVTDFTYDAINRPLTVEYPSDGSLDVAMTYDSASGCGTAYKGRLCSVTDASGTTTYEYDLLGRVTEQEETRGGLTFTTTYTYDLAGNILTITLPSGRVITYTRNANGDVSGVSAVVNGSGATLASSITYLPFGPINAMAYGNSLTFSATYDQDYYLTNRTVSGGIYNHTYDTDDNGNITQVGSTTFNYDELNRLEEEDSGSAVNYTYDATSNRLTRVNGGTTTTTVPAGSNKISAVGGDSYSYDAAGNITDDDTNEYTWNAEGELSVVEVSSSPVGTYTYNAFRQRTKKVAASTVHYVYGAGGLLYGEYDNSGDLIREYVYLNGEPLAQIDTGSPEVLTYLHIDHLGTPKFATNTGGTQVWSWAPDAFGVGSPSGSVTVNLRMAGQYYDSESGIFYNWNRYYNPAIGRFISSDPIGLEGGINTFGYVAQNPVMGIDPYGQFGLIGGAIGGAADLAYQLYKHGGNVACVNWWQVGAVATAGSGVGLLARSGLGALGTLFADSRAFSTISRAFWKARGGAKGWSLDHWAISQKAIRDGLVSPKIGNAGWNLLTMWAPLNRWLGFAQKWGPVQRALARFARGGILFGIPSLSLGAAYFGYEMGMNALNNPCECE